MLVMIPTGIAAEPGGHMWNDVVTLGVPWSEKVLRTVAVYLVLALLLRLAGKRDLAQLNTFDLLVILLLSNVVQNAIIGPDNSLLGGLFGAGVLLAINAAFVRAAGASDRVATLIEGRPTSIVRNGRWDSTALRRLGLRRADVDAAMRHQGARDVGDVDQASIEPGGALVVTLRSEEQPATKADVAALLAEIRRLEARIAANG
jgi:uncharacterized membrane protein YcaP (DUF421 family)